MSMRDWLTDVVGDLYLTVANLFHMQAGSHIDLETMESDKTTFVRSDGTLTTMVRLLGVTRMIGHHEIDRHLEQLSKVFSRMLSRPGHPVQIVFRRSSETVHREIDELLEPARKTANRLELDMQWILDAKRDALASWCADEQCWLALSTNFDIYAAAEAKTHIKARAKKAKGIPFGVDAQWMAGGDDVMVSAHQAMVQSVITEMGDIGLVAETVPAHDAIRILREELDPGVTSSKWRPLLPGDPLPLRRSLRKGDLSSVLYPRLVDQIMPRGAEEIIQYRWIRIGSRYYAPVVMTLPPQSVLTFQVMLGQMVQNDIPFRMAFSLSADGLGAMGLRPVIAGLLHFTSTSNKQFNAAMEGLREQLTAGETIIGLRVLGTTWADDLETLRNRDEMLQQAIQAWGQAETRDVVGDPLMGVTASVPCASRVNPAPISAPPIDQAVKMLPLARPASPWRIGALPFRTPDGKLMPFQPGSSLQTAAVTIGFATMGRGKSVLLNAYNMALIMSPGVERLPFISILDIGPSSSGLISLIRGSLPPEKRHLAIYHRLQMREEHAINPFDTPLGLRLPLASHRAALIDLLTVVCTPEGQTHAMDGVSGILSMVVDGVYDHLQDGHAPRAYDPRTDPETAAFVDKANVIDIDEHTTWWEIVDALFEAGYIAEAVRAQRNAVPVLSDCAWAVRDPSVTSVFTGVAASTQEKIVDYVWRSLNEAISKYPVLAHPTRMDLGNARIISMDLADVAPKGGAAADKQTGIMYSLARYALAQHYYFDETDARQFPEKYQKYHLERARNLRTDIKALCMDEFHRTKGIEGVRSQVVRDIREGRKFNVQVALFSQDVKDFDDIIVSLSSTRFVLGAETSDDAKAIVERFGLTQSAHDVILNRMPKPSARGAPIYMNARTNKGSVESLLYNTLGPIEMWAYDSTAENRALRDLLYERIGARDTLEALANRFPSGSAVEEIERRKRAAGGETNIQGISFTEELAQELEQWVVERRNTKTVDRLEASDY